MRIYKLRADLAYQSLWPATDAEYEILREFRGDPWADRWKPLTVTRYSGSEARRGLPLSDFPGLRSNTPVFSRRAADGLSDLLAPYGELLPLHFSEADYMVYNVTLLVDALDEERASGVGTAGDRSVRRAGA